MNHIKQWLLRHLRLLWEAFRDLFPILCWIFRTMIGAKKKKTPPGQWKRERRRARGRCVPINEPAYKRADPLLYSQYYMTQLGIAVTWNNPDIQLLRNGEVVSSSALEADTEYEVVARIWNGSTEAPVIDLPVRFSYLSFGVGTISHPIGEAHTSLGVKGGPQHPAFAKTKWTTPKEKGHYCIQVLLDWYDDVNPLNNLGQENVDVIQLHSPATSQFTLRNTTGEQMQYRFTTDAYVIPRRPPCPERGRSADAAPTTLAPHAPEHHPLPEGWTVDVDPLTPELAPDEERLIHVTVTAPEGFKGKQAVNVDVFHRYGLAGGVTLFVEGK